MPVSGAWGAGESKNLGRNRSPVQSPETKTLMTYGKSNGWLDDQPAAVTRKVGQGSITYLGMSLEGATAEVAAKWMLERSGCRAGSCPKCRRVSMLQYAAATARNGAYLYELQRAALARSITLRPWKMCSAMSKLPRDRPHSAL